MESYELFLSVEEATELPAIRSGFPRVDEFVKRANSILRAGKPGPDGFSNCTCGKFWERRD